MQVKSNLHASNLPRIEHLTENWPKILAHGVIVRVVLANRLSDQIPAIDPGILSLPLGMTYSGAFVQ
jgi:hypothetical protein